MADTLQTPLLTGAEGSSPGPCASACALNKSCFLSNGKGPNGDGLVDAEQRKVQRKLLVALILASLFLCVEVVGGYLAQSVAIMSDAAHMLSDVASFGLSLVASYAVTWTSHHSYSFGYHRAEIIGALFSTLIIWAVTGALVWEAVQRVINPQPVNGKIMFIVAVAGVFFNILLSFVLGEHHVHGLGGHDHDHGHGHGHDHAHGVPKHSHGASCSHGSGAHRHSHDDHAHDHDHDDHHSHSSHEGHSHSHEGHTHSHADEEQGGSGAHHDHDRDHHAGCNHDHDHDHGHDHDHEQEEQAAAAGVPPLPTSLNARSSVSELGEAVQAIQAAGASAADSQAAHRSHSSRPHAAGSPHGKGVRVEGRQKKAHPPGKKGGHGHVGSQKAARQQHQHHEEHHSCGDHGHGHSHDDHGHDHGHGHGHSHANMNMRSAVLHVLGDLLQSIGVAIAGALIWWHQDDPRWVIADPVCTFLFAALVLLTTRGIIQDIIHTLMERTPVQHDIVEILAAMHQIEGVRDVHDLHVWNLSMGLPILTAHVHADPDAPTEQVLKRLEAFARARGIKHSTVQICNPPNITLEQASSQALQDLPPV